MREKDRRSKRKEDIMWNMGPEMCISILGRSLMVCCILSVALFHHCDAVVENKKTEVNRDHRVTLIMDGIVPGIVSDDRTTLTRILSPSRRRVASSTTSTATTTTFSRVSRIPPTATPIVRPVQPSTGRRTAAARNDCCVVGQVYAKTNMSCEFTSTSSSNEPASRTLKWSEIEGRVGTMSSSDAAAEGRVPLVGRRIDRMLLKCLTYDDLEVHMKKCCRNEKKLEATRKCRRLINARQRRICRSDAAARNS